MSQCYWSHVSYENMLPTVPSNIVAAMNVMQ